MFTITDDNNNLSVSVIGGLPMGSSLIVEEVNGSSEATFLWSLDEIVDVSLVFEARDERNAVSLLNVQVLICACENGGECNSIGLGSLTGGTVVLNCDCPDGKYLGTDSTYVIITYI